MTADERDELIFLYAGGALEGEERDEVEAWLARGDPDAAARLAAARSELARLAHALPPIAPSPAVKQRLMRRIEAAASSPQTPMQPDRVEYRPAPAQAASARSEPQASEDHRAEARAASEASEVTRHAAARRRPLRWLSHPVVAAGIAALAAAFLGSAVAQRSAERASTARVESLRGELESVEQRLAALRSELDQTSAERAQLDRDLADEEAARRSLESDLVLARKAISVLSSEKAEALALVATSGHSARARVVWDWENWYCFLHVTGLDAHSGQLYALWLFSDTGEVVGLGPFEADASGEATLVAPVPHDLGHVVRAGVSIEPDRDLSSQPRGEVVLSGEARRHS